jgi:hypothetical protein
MEPTREYAVQAIMETMGWSYHKSQYWENTIYYSKSYGWSNFPQDYTKSVYEFIEKNQAPQDCETKNWNKAW